MSYQGVGTDLMNETIRVPGGMAPAPSPLENHNLDFSSILDEQNEAWRSRPYICHPPKEGVISFHYDWTGLKYCHSPTTTTTPTTKQQ